MSRSVAYFSDMVRVVFLVLLFTFGAVFGGTAAAQDPAVEREFERATQLHQSGDLQGAIRGYLAILANNPA